MLTTDSKSHRVHVLRALLTGELVLPGDPEWDEVRRAWNLSVAQPPLAVAPTQATALAAIGPGAQVSVTVRSPG